MSAKNPTDFKVITHKYNRPDAIGKVTGQTKYCQDMKFHGMLYGAVHLSTEPHAEILSINTSEAESSEGVVRVFTAKDIPGALNTSGYISNLPILASKRVRYVGDVVAFVVAVTERQARKAAEKIQVEYKVLPSVTDPLESMKPTAPKLADNGNICEQLHTVEGNVEQGFAEADVIVEGIYRSPCIEHEYMEVECAIAIYDGTVLSVFGPAQYPYETHKQVAETLGFDLAHVIINQTPIGGSYGGKAESMNIVSSLAALAAYTLNKPVMASFTREESMRNSGKRHPYVLHYKAGVTSGGEFTAIQVKNVGDTGPYSGNAPYVLFRSHAQAAGPYNWKNWKVDSYMVLTNNGYGSAMRGFGNPQIILATESIIDELAEKIGMDPIDLRLRNAFEKGSVTMTDQVLDNMPVHFKNVIERARKISDWDNKRKEYAQDTGRFRRGIGLASSWRGCSFGGEGYDWGSAIVTLLKDGTLSISCAVIESGQGAKAVMAQIAGEVMGISPDKIHYLPGQTTITPDILTTSASRGTMIGGSSIKLATEELRQKMFVHAAEILDSKAENLTATNNRIWDATAPEKELTYKELANTVFWKQDQMTAISWYVPPKISWNPKTGKGSSYFTFHWMAHAIDLTVDTETGNVKINHVYAVHDPGLVLNPDMARGQVIGAVSWGIGFGLTEEVKIENGQFKTLNLDAYKIMRAADMPPVTVDFLNIPDPTGPFGAKSIGEPGLDVPGGAIANAIAHATGRHPKQLPVTPERLLSLLKEESK